MSDRAPAGLDRDVKAYYDHSPEETRLSAGPSRLEEYRTRELILRHAPAPHATVLDVGGAAGAYSFWLAERGYDVRLVDAVPRLVDVARRRNETAQSRLRSCSVGDARKLEDADESADMVLLLGPLYHLVDQRDRLTALGEALRVLRPGGVLVAAAISRWGSALDGLARELFRDADFARIVERDLVDGQHRNPTPHLDYFTTAYFHRPEELRQEVSETGFDVDAVYGVEGPAWILPDLMERWGDTARREMVLDVARKLESEPSVVGCSAHILAVGRKRNAS